MKILHVTIGDVNVRKGGLTNYCRLVSNKEKELGNEVYYLYPGKISNKTIIKKGKKNSYILNGALPVPIVYGIDFPRRYMKKSDVNVYSEFLKELKPDIIHVHTIQGFHYEFFLSAKELGIKMVFTSHDYYPICSKTNYMYEGKLCLEEEASKCAKCNSGCGLSERRQRIIQSKYYPILIRFKFITYFLKKFIKSNSNVENTSIKAPLNNLVKDFDEYILYKKKIMKLFDIIHFNSSLTSEIYSLSDQQSCIIPISFLPSDNKKHIHNEKNNIVIAYLGGSSVIKGFNVFENAIDRLSTITDVGWEARFYGGYFVEKNSKNKKYFGYFGKKEAEKVWNDIDILVAPSICAETFGFIVIEALSRNIPVVCSNMYGAVDFVKKVDKNLVFESGDYVNCSKKIEWLLVKDNYVATQKKISSCKFDFSIDDHVNKILYLYNELLTHK